MSLTPENQDLFIPQASELERKNKISASQHDTVLVSGADSGIQLGDIVNQKYRLIDYLGEGGMGLVYKVEHMLLPNKKYFALKLLRPELCYSPMYQERFLRETEIALDLVHENAVQIRDFGETEKGLYYFTMDYSPGISLKDILEEENLLEETRALDLIKQILSALKVAHEKGIIHRDIKPDNVLIEERNGKEHALVLDLGIAKYTEETGREGITKNVLLLGTPYYMSPEQAASEKLDIRSDLYSVGVMLYEMVTGVVPFTGKTMAVVYAQMEEQPIPPKQRCPNLSLKVEKIIQKAMEKKAEKRFQTALEFIESIETGMEEQPKSSQKFSCFKIPKKKTDDKNAAKEIKFVEFPLDEEEKTKEASVNFEVEEKKEEAENKNNSSHLGERKEESDVIYDDISMDSQSEQNQAKELSYQAEKLSTSDRQTKSTTSGSQRKKSPRKPTGKIFLSAEGPSHKKIKSSKSTISLTPPENYKLWQKKDLATPEVPLRVNNAGVETPRRSFKWILIAVSFCLLIILAGIFSKTWKKKPQKKSWIESHAKLLKQSKIKRSGKCYVWQVYTFSASLKELLKKNKNLSLKSKIRINPCVIQCILEEKYSKLRKVRFYQFLATPKKVWNSEKDKAELKWEEEVLFANRIESKILRQKKILKKSKSVFAKDKLERLEQQKAFLLSSFKHWQILAIQESISKKENVLLIQYQ